MSAIETERGVGVCPERPEGFGHVWAGALASGDRNNPCRFCGYSGRSFFREATGARAGLIGPAHTSMESGTGNPQRAYPKGMSPEMRARLEKVRGDIARDDAERPWSGEGADRRRVRK